MLFFLSALLIDKHGSLYSVIDGAIHGVVVTVLWWSFDQGHEQIKASIKEDEADRKRKESNKNNYWCPIKSAKRQQPDSIVLK